MKRALLAIALVACSRGEAATLAPAPNLTQSGGFAPTPSSPPPPTGDVPSPLSAPGVAPAPALACAVARARESSALAPCTPYETFIATWNDEQPIAAQCGQAADRHPVDIDRMIALVPPLDETTAARVRALFATGEARGRHADIVALVGDSITIDHAFLRPMSDHPRLSPAVRDALAVDDDRTIVDVFRARYDSFTAPRAAKIGARVKWAISYNAAMKTTPVDDIVTTLSPAFAVVMYGTNDAQWWPPPAERVAREYKRELEALVASLESRGVVPILTTLPQHGRDKRFPDCPDPGRPLSAGLSNREYAVQTAAVSAAVAEVACEHALPLIDLRAALEPLLDHGVAPDGVHPSLYFKGAGVLDEHGLACGFNVRNFVTLLALKRVRAAALADSRRASSENAMDSGNTQ